MRIGILVPSIGAFGQKGFYNAQEIGLAKALGRLCSEVKVYRLIDRFAEERTGQIEGCNNATVWFLPAKRIGNNGFVDLSILDSMLDALVFFSDTQIIVPQVARWAKRNGVLLLPYIGVIESHSASKLKKTVMDFLFARNVAIYKKHHCMVKTPKVKEALHQLGVNQITVAPVGLDLSLLKADYTQADTEMLKQKYGYATKEKVLLFVGRMTEEKQPLRMIGLFDKLYHQDCDYRLLMVGVGELRDAVDSTVEIRGLSNYVQIIDRIPNKNIWELYRIADSFVNLNQQEIFGMAILEAMYYGCKVVAWKAPGPSFIIEDGVSGFLADSDVGILEAIAEKTIAPKETHERIINHFTWDKTAEKIVSLAERK